MQKITTFLWFDDKAEEAAKFYVSIFPNSKIAATTRYGDTGPGPAGRVMTVDFDATCRGGRAGRSVGQRRADARRARR